MEVEATGAYSKLVKMYKRGLSPLSSRVMILPYSRYRCDAMMKERWGKE